MSGYLRIRLECALEEADRWTRIARDAEWVRLQAKIDARVATCRAKVARLEAWEAHREASGEDPPDEALVCASCFGEGLTRILRESCLPCEGTGVAGAPALPEVPA